MNISQIIEQKSDSGSVKGRASQDVQFNNRLAHIVGLDPIRPIKGHKMLTITTENHITGVKHTLVLSHDPGNGTNRFNTYLNGDRWRNGWSRWRFVNWMFRQIDSVRSDWG